MQKRSTRAAAFILAAVALLTLVPMLAFAMQAQPASPNEITKAQADAAAREAAQDEDETARSIH
ncbi:MAG TPA: hypothetical protein VF147_13930, partial [Vicinamibacterales bacterium]